jgi:hypothetical protein
MAQAGYLASVLTSLNGTDFAEIAGGDSWDWSFSPDKLTSTAFGDTAENSFRGLMKGQCQVSGRFVTGDTNGQARIVSACLNGTTIYIRRLYDGTNGHQAAAKVYNYSDSASVDGRIEFSCTFDFIATPTAVPA